MKSKDTKKQRSVWVARDKHKDSPLLIHRKEPQLERGGLWWLGGWIGEFDYLRGRRLGILKVTLRPGQKRRLPVGEVFGG